MAVKDEKEINLDIFTRTADLDFYRDDVNRKFEDLMVRVDDDGPRSSDDKHFIKLRKNITVLKKNQDVVSKKFSKFNLHIDMSLKDFDEGFEKFKNAEDYLNMRLNELMIKLGEQGGGVLMEGLKIQEDHVENKMKDRSIIGGQRVEDVSDLKSTDLGIERLKIQEEHVFETSKSGEEGGSVLMEGLKILADAVENKINDGSDIGGQREDVSDSKSMELGIGRLKKIQEEYMDRRLNELAPAFDRSGHGSDVNFEKTTESGTSNDLGADHKLLPEKDKDNKENSLIYWIKILETTKDRAVELGTELSFLLVDLRFIASEERMAKFQEFKSSLELIFKDKNFMVIKKIIEVLEMVDGEMRKMKELKKVKKEKMEETDLNVSEVKEGLIEGSQIDHLLVLILNEVLNLEYVLMHPRLPDENMSKKDVLCWEELKAIDTKIDELKQSYTVIFGSEEMNRVQFCTRELQGRIKEIWNQSGESLEENERRNN